MNYRDVVLKLLRKRDELQVLEDVMLADFSNAEDPLAAFEKWCSQYYIKIIRQPNSRRITLQKIRKSKS